MQAIMEVHVAPIPTTTVMMVMIFGSTYDNVTAIVEVTMEFAVSFTLIQAPTYLIYDPPTAVLIKPIGGAAAPRMSVNDSPK